MQKTTYNGCTLYTLTRKEFESGESEFFSNVRVIGGRVYVLVDDMLPGRRGRGLSGWYRIGKLISLQESSPKLRKNGKIENTLSSIHYGAPARVAGLGINQCSHATSCADTCLNTAGRGRTAPVALARVARTRFEVFAPELFWKLYRDELQTIQRTAERAGAVHYHRPDGTTDRLPKALRDIVKEFSATEFYGYTANPTRDKVAAQHRLSNYNVVFSRKETERNHQHCTEWWHRGGSISAVVSADVKAQFVGTNHAGIRWVDFDARDLRHPDHDGAQAVGLLSPKGPAKQDDTGFVLRSVDDVRAFAKLLTGGA